MEGRWGQRGGGGAGEEEVGTEGRRWGQRGGSGDGGEEVGLEKRRWGWRGGGGYGGAKTFIPCFLLVLTCTRTFRG